MTKFKKAIQYIFIGLFAIPAIVYYCVFYIFRYAKNPQKYPFEKRYDKVRKMAKFVLQCYGSKFFFYNSELINNSNEQSMIVCNHLSDLDPLAVITMSKRPLTFVAKKEAMSYPFVGPVLRALEAYPIDRDNVVSQFATIKAIVKHLKDKSKPPVVVFIEGTRNRHPETRCLDFHPGTLKIASMADVPVVKLSIYGTFRHLTLKSYLHRYPIFIDISKPISKEDVKSKDLNVFAEELKKDVDDKIDEFRKLDQSFVYAQWLTRHRKALETTVDTCVNS